MSDITDTAFDLDALEREDAPKPFWTKLGGRRYRIMDPQDLKFDELLTITLRPGDILPAAVAEEDRDAFREALGDMPAWKVNALAKKYMEHHGMPSDPEAPAFPA